MLFKRLLIVIAAVFATHSASAAEWRAEPGLTLSSIYNDNVGMRSVDEQDSTGYTVAPRIQLEAREPNWDVGMTALVKVTRYSDVEDIDSDNYFFTLDNGYSTERHNFRLDGSFSRNTTYDTDYDTELPGADLVDDLTERESTNITPSWQWQTSESSSLSVSLDSSDIEYDEVVSTAYKDYQMDTATIKSIWNIGERSQLGFTLSYSEYENQKETWTVNAQDYDVYREFENQVYQLDYIYKPSETSQLSMSLGRRKLESISHGELISCQPSVDFCLAFPEIGDVNSSDDGTVVTADYTHSNEVSSINIAMSRMVIPSSFGGAQEEERASIRYTRSFSERFSGDILLDGYETTTIDGENNGNDRKRYRIEPGLSWRLKEHWRLGVSYRYIQQTLSATDTDSDSSAIYLNLSMRWPNFASSY